VLTASNYAFEFDSVLGDLENMDSIASFPSEAKSQCLVSGRSHINIHVDCRSQQTVPPPSGALDPLPITPGAYAWSVLIALQQVLFLMPRPHA